MAQAVQAGKGRKSTNATAAPINELSAQALKQFQAAVQAMQQGKYDKAEPLFESIIVTGPIELADRSRVYLTACRRSTVAVERTFISPTEEYDYAVSLLNTGDYEEARSHFESILAASAAADYAHYGLAVLESMTGQPEACISHLTQAIELNSHNRIQARSDSDFQDMADDPRFTELLYPEAPQA